MPKPPKSRSTKKTTRAETLPDGEIHQLQKWMDVCPAKTSQGRLICAVALAAGLSTVHLQELTNAALCRERALRAK